MLLAQGAIDGLKEFYKHDDVKIVVDVANFLVEKLQMLMNTL